MHAFRQGLTSLCIASAVLATVGAAWAQAPSAAAGPGTPAMKPVVPPLIRLDPTEVRTKPTLAAGCWVWLFPKDDFKGPDDIAIAGPAEVRSLHTPIGLDWKEKTESLITGPKASVTVFENGNFQDRQTTLQPGTQLTHLRQKLKYTQSIDSLKVSCTP